jgi:hypothetical protein
MVELMIALIMASVLCFAVLKIFMTTQRFSDALAQKVDVQQNLRAAMAILPSDLRQLDAADGDIKAMSATSITIRAMRQVGVVCTVPIPALPAGPFPGVKTIVVRRPLYSGSLFQAPNGVNYDSVFVWNEGNSAIRTDDGWWPGRVTLVSSAVNCLDGSPGQQLTVSVNAPVPNLAGGVPLGAPVRGFETVTYSLIQAADTRWYLNITTNNGAGTTGPTPIVGPLAGATGVAFTYFNAAGAVTAVPAQVAQIGLVIRGQSLRQVHLPGPMVGFKAESLSTTITLRNNPRF